MHGDATWSLPEGIEEMLPQDAAKLEQLRRQVLDDFTSRGFDLVRPPLMEFVDSLLTGTGEALDTQTYKFMDQYTHRTLGVRADMTPQIARLDAHYLADNEVNRLCYAGTVLRTQADQMGGQRELLQCGAELFGVEDESADIEIIDAMLATLAFVKPKRLTLSLGHVGLYRSLIELADISKPTELELFDALIRKSLPDVRSLEADHPVENFITLLRLQGDVSVLADAREQLPKTDSIEFSINQLQSVVDHLSNEHKQVSVHIDLADVFGYRYHTGLKFFAYAEGRGQTIAKGGRYDRIGESFGRARPATGFSVDLKSLVKLS